MEHGEKKCKARIHASQITPSSPLPTWVPSFLYAMRRLGLAKDRLNDDVRDELSHNLFSISQIMTTRYLSQPRRRSRLPCRIPNTQSRGPRPEPELPVHFLRHHGVTLSQTRSRIHDHEHDHESTFVYKISQK